MGVLWVRRRGDRREEREREERRREIKKRKRGRETRERDTTRLETEIVRETQRDRVRVRGGMGLTRVSEEILRQEIRDRETVTETENQSGKTDSHPLFLCFSLLGTLDGAVGALVPLEETTFKRLFALQNRMVFERHRAD